MYNWSTDEKKLKKNKERYAIWALEQMVNFGLGGKKIREKDLRKYWTKLQLDPARKKFLELFLNEGHTNRKTNRLLESRRQK